ncbi:hypothetical protein V500_09127 [Pseudogymnoascus sp. VKM F-4518 (FW-2643)]|nr:hypothetical protein V500_09127 [Pseudogymnoascus sp. VKM F-4518 (FW-2643)]
MSLNKGEAGETQLEHNVDSGNVEKPKRGPFGTFVRKWWWAILIVLAIGALVVILPLVLVGFPRIIQDKVNKSTLSIDGISVTNTKTDTVLVSINSSVSSSNSIPAVVEAFDAIMYLEDKLPHTTIMTLRMPETKTGLALVNVSQEISGASNQAFIDFNSWYLWNSSLAVTIEGETHVRVKGLKPAKVTFKKTVTLVGVNGFTGLNVTQANINVSAVDNNFNGYADIPNPSILTFEVGNVTFGNYFEQKKIGTLFIDDMFIRPGTNNVSVRATISQEPVITAVQKKPYCDDGILPFDLLGESVINHGQPLAYFADALALHAQSTKIRVGAALKAAGLDIAHCKASTTSSAAAATSTA